MFFLELTGFDVPPHYVGVDGKADGHVIVEGTQPVEGVSRPCIGDAQPGLVTAGPWTVTEWRCSSNALLVQGQSMHGEGAHLGHLLLAWSQDGVDYIVSVHGHTAASRTLIEQMVASTVLVPPPST